MEKWKMMRMHKTQVLYVVINSSLVFEPMCQSHYLQYAHEMILKDKAADKSS